MRVTPSQRPWFRARGVVVFSHSIVGQGSTILYGNPSAVNTYSVIAVDSSGNASPPATITVNNF